MTTFGARTAILVAAALAVLPAACGGGASPAAGPATAGPGERVAAVRIGYFPNVTHAPALIADARGLFASRIGADKTKITTFNAGPEMLQALLSGSLDIGYIGPNPTITAYARSDGGAVRVIAGSTSGGAALVVKPEITSPAGLKGKKIATPQLGNTQDVALRYWLTTQQLTATTDGGGDVSIVPQKNSAAVAAFATGRVDGAWVPEPFATQLVQRGGTVLVDERTLWPGGRFVTTNVIARTEFLTDRPAAVSAFLQAHLDALDAIAKDPGAAQADVAAQIGKITEQDVDQAALAQSWRNLSFTADPLPATLKESARHAERVGLLQGKPDDDFARLWDLSALNQALTGRGQQEVGAP